MRLPRAARPRLETAEAVEGWDPLAGQRRGQIHAMNHKGRGTRVAVIDADFSGWRGLVGTRLPDDMRMVDLTRERNDDVKPDPEPGDGKTPGHGVHMALAVLRAAPEAEIVLVRIDPAAPYMLQEVARAMNGETPRLREPRQPPGRASTPSASSSTRRPRLLLEERRHFLNQFTDATQKEILLKRKEKGVITSDEEEQLKQILDYEAYEKRQADWDRRDQEYHEAVERFLRLEKGLIGLKSVRVAASGLVWDDGHPADAGIALTRYFDDQPFGSALWFQAAGDARGQAWTGPFRDDDSDGVLQFDSAEGSPNDSLWARRLDFLAWAPDGGKTTLDLPAGARVRISLQWREAHDPEAGRPGEDPYLKPLADLRIVVLSQPDPAGATRPADDMDVVVQSVGPPQRLQATPSSAVYEQTVLLQVAKAGRYAVRIEGTAPTSTRPRDDPDGPGGAEDVRAASAAVRRNAGGSGPGAAARLRDGGRHAGDAGRLARRHHRGRGRPPRPAAALQPGGPPYDVTLLAKPDVLAYDQGVDGKDAAQGTGVAAGFAAGVAAAARGMGAATAAGWRDSMGVEPGGVVHGPK